MPRPLCILLFVLLPLSVSLTRPCLGQEKDSDSDSDSEAGSDATAAIVLSRQEKPLEFETLRGLAEGAAVRAATDAEGKGPVRFTVEWNAAKVRIREREDGDREVRNGKIQERVSRFPKEDPGAEAPAAALREAIPAVKRTYGILLPHGFDSGGTSTAFLLKLAAHEDGFIFWNDVFYDRQGFRILGDPGAPLLGRRGGNLLTSPSGGPARPEDYFPGVWKSSGSHTMSAGERIVTLRVESQDHYGGDGAYTTKGTLTFTADSPEDGKQAGGDGDASANASVDISMTGSWRIGREKQLVTAGECKTGDIRGGDPFLKKLLEMTVGELLKDNGEPDESWLISRGPDTLYLEGRKLGLVSEMKRIKTEK
ncbi:MAG: hypothetical protein JWM59_2568 [Verrucomicrobiales bacterium]|nr:hypothetical protein [Verrucomicrobiales bacterium]